MPRTAAMPRLVLHAALVSSLACSLTLEWREEGQPCREGAYCNAGSSCFSLVDEPYCIPEYSVAVGWSCSSHEQCVRGARCFDNLCQESCSGGYYALLGSCGEGEVCVPVAPGTGACRALTDCASRSCSAAQVCAPLAQTEAGICAEPCDVTWNAGEFGSACEGRTGARAWITCEVIADTPVCVASAADPAQGGEPGDPCEPGSGPCRHGAFCRAGRCRGFCDPGDAATCVGGTCRTEAGGSYAWCDGGT